MPNETNPIPTESKCRGGLIVCKKNSKKEGVTLLDHLEKNHPELFTKEHEAMFACRTPIPKPEVGDRNKNTPTRSGNKGAAISFAVYLGSVLKKNKMSLPSMFYEAVERSVIDLLSRRESEWRERAERALGDVVKAVDNAETNEIGEEQHVLCVKAAVAAADRIKKENL